MKDYSKLTEMLEHELDVIEGRDRLDMNTLEIADKVIHSLKNLCKIKEYREAHKHIEESAEKKSWDSLTKEEKDLRWYNKMMNDAKTEEERALITRLMNMRSE